jgi:DNA repair protein RecO (recombination protein O)
MLHRTEGIVLRTVPFGDADLIVSFLTPDLGLLKTFAKSPLKTKSRFGSSLEPLTYSKIAFWGKENAALPRLTQSDIIHSFQSIRDTLNCFLKASEIIELTLRFIPEREANKRVYSLFLNTLHNIENNPPSRPFGKDNPLSPPFGKGGIGGLDIVILYFKIHFLRLAGFAPKLDTCGRCGKHGNWFYVAQGSILCETCAKGVDVPIRITQGALKLYLDLLTWNIQKIQRIRPSNMLLLELSDIMDMHLKYILMQPLKSETFFRSLSSQV